MRHFHRRTLALRGTVVDVTAVGEITVMTRIVLAAAALCLSASLASAQDVARGKQEFVDSKCTVCHLVGGEGNKKGPVLDGVGAKLTPDEIRQWITNAPEMAAKAKIDRKPPMKAYTDFPKDKVDALVAYLSSLKK